MRRISYTTHDQMSLEFTSSYLITHNRCFLLYTLYLQLKSAHMDTDTQQRSPLSSRPNNPSLRHRPRSPNLPNRQPLRHLRHRAQSTQSCQHSLQYVSPRPFPLLSYPPRPPPPSPPYLDVLGENADFHLVVSVFCGQLMGTAVGNKLYARGGWIASGSASVGFTGAALLVCLARGPWEKGWIGWGGGWGIRRRDLGPKKEEPATEQVLDEVSAEEAPESNVANGALDGKVHRSSEKSVEEVSKSGEDADVELEGLKSKS